MPLKLTFKVQGFLIGLGISQSIDQYCFKYIYDRCPQNGDCTMQFDHQDFVRHFKKYTHGREISKRTIYRILGRLAEFGLIEMPFKGFSSIIRVNFLPGFFCQNRPSTTEESQESESIEDKPARASAQKNACKELLQQQQIIAIKQLVNSLGFTYRLNKDWREIFSYSWDEIVATVNYVRRKLARGGKAIYNLPGFFRQALRDSYYLDDSSPVSWIDNLRQAFSSK